MTSNNNLGQNSLSQNSSINNTSLGLGALENNKDSSNNTGIGAFALYNNINGSNNVGVGTNTLLNNTSGYNNVAIGPASMVFLSSTNENTAIGANSLQFNISGSNNVAVGSAAGINDVKGNKNTYLGCNAGQLENDILDYEKCTAIGYDSKFYPKYFGKEQVVLGIESSNVIIPGNLIVEGELYGSFTGPMGPQGFQGSNTGYTGPQGYMGTQGNDGQIGFTGAQGYQGTNSGFTGPQGIIGPQGMEGQMGSQGIEGVQGSQGSQGSQGIEGVQGAQGAQGIQGVAGAQGIRGSQGLKGSFTSLLGSINNLNGIEYSLTPNQNNDFNISSETFYIKSDLLGPINIESIYQKNFISASLQLAVSSPNNEYVINFVSATIMRDKFNGLIKDKLFYPTTINLATGTNADINCNIGTGFSYLKNSLFTWSQNNNSSTGNLLNLNINMNAIDQNFSVNDKQVYYAIRIYLSGYSTSLIDYSESNEGSIYCGNVRLIGLKVF